MKESTSFQSVIAAALVAITDAGGITARALPARFDGASRLIPYRGSNILLLALAGRDLPSSIWGTANVLRDATGCLVAKGQTSLARVVFAGMGDAPAKKADPLLAQSEIPAEPEDPTLPKGKVRIYRTIASFNASQLAGADLEQALLSGEQPSSSLVDSILSEALEERARHPAPGEKPLDKRLCDAVMAMSRAMVNWWHGKEATLSAGWFESTSDLLTVAGVAQSCVDALRLPAGIYAYGVPRLIDPAGSDVDGDPIAERPAAGAKAPKDQCVAVSPPTDPQPAADPAPEKAIKAAQATKKPQEEALAEFLGQKIDLDW